MQVKEYLSQARYLDFGIRAKMKQVESLNRLATEACSALLGTPHGQNRCISKTENTVVKIIDLQNEIRRDIDRLVDRKRKIAALICAIDSPVQQALLEKRYLCFQPWEQIAADLGFSMHYLYKVHNVALEKCEKILKEDTKRH